jgi:hypothetical protein
VEKLMQINVRGLIVALALAASNIVTLGHPSVATAAPVIGAHVLPAYAQAPGKGPKCGSPSNPCPTCTIEISTVSLTPLVAYDGSGGNVLFSGPEPTEAQCDHQAIAQWNNALATGWSAANRCAIIAGTGPSDEILTEITYIYNGGPSVRSDGYAVMCSHTVNVSGVPAY